MTAAPKAYTPIAVEQPSFAEPLKELVRILARQAAHEAAARHNPEVEDEDAFQS